MTEAYGINQRGGDYRNCAADDLRACQNICKGDPRCRAYNLDTRERTCWLKNRVNSQQRIRDTVTGFKQ